MQIPVTQLAGSSAKFTVFDAFAPITGAFIGSVPGVIAVLLMHSVNFLVHGAQVQDVGTIIRFFPMLFAVLYFALGIAASYIVVNNLLYILEQKNILKIGLPIDLKFVYSYNIRHS